MCATLTTIGSGSSGNAYCLDVNGERLLIEVGLPWKQILKALNFNLEDVRACLVSHAHR